MLLRAVKLLVIKCDIRTKDLSKFQSGRSTVLLISVKLSVKKVVTFEQWISQNIR